MPDKTPRPSTPPTHCTARRCVGAPDPMEPASGHVGTHVGYTPNQRGINQSESTYPQPYAEHIRHLYATDSEENKTVGPLV